MLERKVDFWALAQGVTASCVTTNGTIKRSGLGVMGRGIAKQAWGRYPLLARSLGEHLQKNGNVVGCIQSDSTEGGVRRPLLLAFPVKHQWHEPADLDLIEQSAHQLKAWIQLYNYTLVALPRPGCGNGQLHWSQVKPVIAPILDDRVIVVSL